MVAAQVPGVLARRRRTGLRLTEVADTASELHSQVYVSIRTSIPFFFLPFGVSIRSDIGLGWGKRSKKSGGLLINSIRRSLEGGSFIFLLF
jgi:hypothetical protein